MLDERTQIEDALAHFGLGRRPDAGTATCVIAAVIDRATETMLICDAMSPILYGREVQRCEFLRSEVETLYYGPNSALVTIPKTYLPIFRLWDFVLPQKIEARFRERAAMHNAPYLKQNDKPAERVGGIRI